jgi:hypothetical protein
VRPQGISRDRPTKTAPGRVPPLGDGRSMKISRDSSRTPRLAGLDFCELGRLPDANGDSGSHATERFCAWQLDLDNERTVERFTEPGRVDDNQWAWFGIFTGVLWRYLNKGEKTDECSDNKNAQQTIANRYALRTA